MPFKYFSVGETISATEINDNFYALFQSDFLPRHENEMSSGVNHQYDLGSADYRWKTLYVNSISSSFSALGFYYITGYNVNTTTLQTLTYEIEFSNMDSSKYIDYMINFRYRLYAFTGTLYAETMQTYSIILNNDTTTNCYSRIFDYFYGTGSSLTLTINSTVTTDGLILSYYTSFATVGAYDLNNVGMVSANLHNSQSLKILSAKAVRAYPNNSCTDLLSTMEMSDTITSIKLVSTSDAGFAKGTHIEIFGKNK